MTINNKTTFKELKKLVGSTKGLAKLPTAKELRNSNEEIVFDGDVAGAHLLWSSFFVTLRAKKILL